MREPTIHTKQGATAYLPVLAAYMVVLYLSACIGRYRANLLRTEQKTESDTGSVKELEQTPLENQYWPINVPVFNPARPNEYYAQLLAEQKRLCGELCTWDENKLAEPFPREPSLHTLHTPQHLQQHFVSKPVDCHRLFDPQVEKVLEPQSVLKSDLVPKSMYNDYSFNGKIAVHAKVMDDSYKVQNANARGSQSYLGGETLFANWSRDVIEEQVKALRQGTLQGSYSPRATNKLFQFLKEVGVAGKNVLVVGSERPWVEVACLEAGAKTVTTLEYGKIYTNHPQLKSYIPSEFGQAYRDGTLPVFDVAVSFSSLEHPGLGRYGDGLNPWGDVVAMAKISCVVRPGGLAVIGLPDRSTTRMPQDIILYPLNRVFGPIRLPYFLTNWRTFKTEEGHHSHVLLAAKNQRQEL